MRIPVPRNRLVALVLVGAVLSAIVSVGLANPALLPDVSELGTEDSNTADSSSQPSNQPTQTAAGSDGASGSQATPTNANAPSGGGDAGSSQQAAAQQQTETATNRYSEVERDGGIYLEVEGEVAPGNTVTVVATQGGSPVSGALVEVNGHVVGRTNGQGQISVPVHGDELRVEAESEHAEGELEIELEG